MKSAKVGIRAHTTIRQARPVKTGHLAGNPEYDTFAADQPKTLNK
jgi:hypothetical protein